MDEFLMNNAGLYSVCQFYQWMNLSEETKAFLREIDARRASVSRERALFFSLQAEQSDDWAALRTALQNGQKPSEYFEKHMDWAFGTFILPRHREAFLWAVNHCLERPYPTGWERRPLRSKHYISYMDLICSEIARSFAGGAVVDADLCDILTGKIPPDALAFVRDCGGGCCAELIAYELNHGSVRLKALLTAALNGEEGAPQVSQKMFLGIQMSGDEELQALLGRLLLAARLQEGLRQSICEAADQGTLPAFRRMLRVIADNDLLRYSSVKRAVGVWTGLASSEATDLERISNKTLDLMLEGLESPDRREEMLAGEDSMRIYMALWTQATEDTAGAVDRAVRLVQTGSRHQTLVCGFFADALQSDDASCMLTKAALTRWPDDAELLAVYLPNFLQRARWQSDLGRGEAARDFADAAEGRRIYEILRAQYSALKGKKRAFDPCIFPWNAAYLNRSELAMKLCVLASILDEADLVDEALSLLPQIDSDYRYTFLKALLVPLKRPCQRRTLMDMLADKSSFARGEAFRIAQQASTEDLDFAAIENHLRLKAADLRVNCEKLLMRQSDDALLETTARLLGDAQEPKRMAAYDLCMLIAADEERKRLQAACAGLLRGKEPADDKERILWESAMQAVGEGKADAQEVLFTDADAYQPELSFLERDDAYREAFFELFPDSAIESGAAGGADCPSCAQARRDLQALDRLVDDHREDPIGKNPVRPDGETLLGYGPLHSHRLYQEFPDAAVWEEWYAGLGGPERLVRAILLRYAEDSADGDLLDAAFGAGFSRPETLRYPKHILSVCSYLFARHVDSRRCFRAAVRLAQWVLQAVPAERFAAQKENGEPGCVVFHAQLCWMLAFLADAPDEEWDRGFAVRAALGERYDREYIPLARVWVRRGIYYGRFQRSMLNYSVLAGDWYGKEIEDLHLGPLDWLKAADRGVVSERTLLHAAFRPDALRRFTQALSQISMYVRMRQGEVRDTAGRGWSRMYRSSRLQRMVEELTGKKEDELTEADQARLRRVGSLYERVLSVLLDSELRRGENDGPYSGVIPGVEYILGAKWLGRILAALGKEHLVRNLPGGYWRLSRAESLCHLLSVCVPAPEDDPDSLNAALKEHQIPDERLYEAAMYTPAWIELIGRHLGISGFDSAAYYFIAHMNEYFGEARKAAIARFTPLTEDELNGGAFDLNWFRSAREAVGEAVFERLYAAAKYITDGAKHSRARKYADAALGRLSVEDTERQIREKRSKDLLMAYPLIPLSGEDDTLRRFLFIQQFLKESRQFGAQRSLSERRACEMALKNLAENSGDQNVIRLTLRMEAKLSENRLALLEPRSVEDAVVRLELTEEGSAAIVCEKDGKRLKSVPARLKKNEAIVQLTAAQKELTEQYRRTRAFLEDAMTDEVALTGAELRDLRKNPVARAIADRLVFKAGSRFGLPVEDGLRDENGETLPWEQCAQVQAAHPLHLYQAGVWHSWQAAMFARRIRQPFRQVFRELYVKTADERGRTESLRYAGYQIQPRKAAAVLKSRRWMADLEAGLQKVFYRENVVAALAAQADWFTPADIEAPTIESVRFFHRLTGKPLNTDKVPDVLFSEVMRDVDLAVSAAFVGGVDPETSHSTIEMRAALLEFVLPMFGVQNVRIDRSHAVVQGKRSTYTVHLGSGVVHQQGGAMLQITAVHSQHRGKLFLPFVEDDPQTSEILTKVQFLAEDSRIQDPAILEQIR